MTTYHGENQLVVERQQQGEEEICAKPCELDCARDGVFVIDVLVLRGLGSPSAGLDIERLELGVAIELPLLLFR